ncbi:MAG TPA: alpha/beta hydrolase-fold protein, partial [Phycisphaerales bacterium]|nr:alpha/beta hydrolase-fold protein [Phycisphaerales bacterium]
EDIAPIAVYVVLDPECELGHHGFADSDNNGPRGEALVREFIPWLEKQFDLVPNADARIVTGHSSGGWSSLWLQLNYPDVFGATWSSAPDPVNFHFFQMTDLYEDGNLFRSPGMQDDTPSYRWYVDATYVPKVLMTVRQETAMEDVLDPHGRSGQQWDTWEAMFSQKDSSTGMPRPMFDSATGTIDAETVAHWQKYDMYKKVDEHWDTLGPVLTQRVRLVVGSVDSYYLNRAVESLKKLVEQKTGKTEEPTPEGQKKKHVDGSKSGYIDIYGGDDHESIVTNTTIRWNKEMRDYLMQHGYQDEGPEYIDDDDNVQMHPVKPE